MSSAYTPDGQLREENETLKQIIAFQDARIEDLLADRADLHRLLGLRSEALNLQQQITEKEG